jgi:hypothetical protein
MEAVDLTICCDQYTIPCLAVNIGVDWIHVNVFTSSRIACERLAADLPRAAAMIAAAGVAGARVSTVTVQGPDSLDKTRAAFLRLEALRLWPPAPAAPALTAPASAAPAPGADNEKLIAQTLGEVSAHLAKYGAAPDFASTRPSARVKTYNYIRSIIAKPHLPEEVVEEVRRRLGAM